MNSPAKDTQAYIAALPDWQAKFLENFRQQIHLASSEVTEEVKWGVPAFIFKSKVVFTMAAFKSHVKYNFILNGAVLSDPNGLFNNGLESAKSRSIDLTKGQTISQSDLSGLISQALAKAG
ncbi:MAG TPA: DUF1801 domain-containing protein [Candidatus Saccharimonadales bacterium]|nr:DUF1801 domain-containing protein [Candidatus Saccharimonadales bacterium]